MADARGRDDWQQLEAGSGGDSGAMAGAMVGGEACSGDGALEKQWRRLVPEKLVRAVKMKEKEEQWRRMKK